MKLFREKFWGLTWFAVPFRNISIPASRMRVGSVSRSFVGVTDVTRLKCRRQVRSELMCCGGLNLGHVYVQVGLYFWQIGQGGYQIQIDHEPVSRSNFMVQEVGKQQVRGSIGRIELGRLKWSRSSRQGKKGYKKGTKKVIKKLLKKVTKKVIVKGNV